MTLTILEMLYIVLIIFSTIIWTLLIITLLRVIKILWPMTEIADFYHKMKKIFSAYSQIPEIVVESVKEKFGKTEEKVEKTEKVKNKKNPKK